VSAPPDVLVVVSARMASSRYPGKALVPLAGRPLLVVLLERMRATGLKLALATSREPENDALVAAAESVAVPSFRGDENDVLRRHVDCARAFGAQTLVRVTGDNPLTDTETLLRLVERHARELADYTYVPGDALLMGILPEVVSRRALERSWDNGAARHRSELVTLYIKEHPQEFKICTESLPEGLYRPDYRLTVDEAADVRLMQALFERLAAPGRLVTTRAALELLDREPELRAINAALRHKPHNVHSVALDSAIVGRS
jgi:spore coat polysaccharide biosynthesis protein SpsF